MKMLARLSALPLVLLLPAGATLAQEDIVGPDALNSPASIRCSALEQVAEGDRAGAVMFLAGYGAGQRDAINVTTGTSVGTAIAEGGEEQEEDVGAIDALTATEETNPEETGNEPAPTNEQPPVDEITEDETAPGAARPGGPSAAILPEIFPDRIIAACAESPDSRVVDIITAQGAANTQ
jgi:hypothetical protein